MMKTFHFSVALAALAILLAAVAQDMIPIVGNIPVKWGFLTAVGIYYVIGSSTIFTLAVLAWAGLLTDALGYLPLGCTFSFLAFIYLVARLLQRVAYWKKSVLFLLLVLVASPCQVLGIHAWAGNTGFSLFSVVLLQMLAVSIFLGLASGLIVFASLASAEHLLGLTGPDSKIGETRDARAF